MKALSALVYGLLWSVGAVIAFIPFRLKSVFATAIGWLMFRVLGLRAKVILHNLVVAFPRESQEAMPEYRRRLERIAQGHYRHLVLVFLEILERFHWSRAVFQRRVTLQDYDEVKRLDAAGQGFFFLTAHLGNWELISLAGSLLNLRLVIVTRFLRNRFFDGIWKRSRLRYGVELLEESGSGLSIIRAVRQGKCVGFILDQYTGPPHGIEVEFFGRLAWCPKGLAIMAPRLNAPVVPAYMVREADGRFRLIFEAPLNLPADDIAAHVLACNANIEKWVRAYPDQYLWVHKRFKGGLDYAAPLPWLL